MWDALLWASLRGKNGFGLTSDPMVDPRGGLQYGRWRHASPGDL